jgi:hypothetical protein
MMLGSSEYPELVACKALPSANDASIEIELTGADGTVAALEVPLAAVRMLNMPRLSKSLPAMARELFERSIGLALVTCRIVERQTNSVKIALPTVSGETEITVPSGSIARRV